MAKCYAFIYLCFALFLSAQSNAAVDTLIGRKAPRSETRNAARLAEYLCNGLSTDREKANAIYNWVTHNIRYNVKSALSNSLKHDDDVKKVLRTRKGICEGYAYLFAAMCQAVGLQAVTVEGYARDWIFDNGDKLYVPRHEWNAVLIDGEWQLVDVTWGAGGIGQAPGWLRRQLNRLSKNPVRSGKLRFIASYDTSYFLQDPEQFRLTHLPTDPIWQLTDTVMPVAIFEAGKSAITQFNEVSQPAQQKDLLGASADFNEIIRTYEYADRAFQYNPRYYGPLAMRELVDAEIQIQFGDSINKYDPMPARYRYGKASRALGMTKEYLKKQQEGYSLEARELKQKNQRKNDSAKKYVREIKTDNKRLTAQCKQKQNSAKSKQQQIANKASALRRLVADKGISSGAKTSAALRPEAMKEAMDSAADRDNQLAMLQTELDTVEGKIQAGLALRKTQLDSLAAALLLSDSLMIQETIAHIRMHDVYDDEVIQYSSSFREAKFRRADTIQSQYQRGYDSLVQYFEDRIKLEYAQLNIYKKSLRSLAKYQQKGGNTVRTRYADLRSAFNTAASTYSSHLNEYRQTTAEYASVFGALRRLYERQNSIAAYMEKAENKRKQLEAQTLERKAALNKKENGAQQALVEKSMKRAKRLAGPKTIES